VLEIAKLEFLKNRKIEMRSMRYLLSTLLILLISSNMSSGSGSGKVIQVSSASARSLLSALVPPLTAEAHKGQMGRVGVIGGSADFTGAPYYAAEASLKFGGDLAFVFAAKQAVIPIKSYSPELMVTSFYDAEALFRIKRAITGTEAEAEAEESEQRAMVKAATEMAQTVVSFLPRLHTLVVGPGLGREAQVELAVLQVLKAARARNLPVVLDADALWMLAQGRNLQDVYAYSECVLTPNANEFRLLIQAALRAVSQNDLGTSERSDESKQALAGGLSSAYVDVQLRALASLLGCTVLLKGPADLVCSGAPAQEAPAGKEGELSTVLEGGDEEGEDGNTSAANAHTAMVVREFYDLDVYQVRQAGSPRRCGGLGDVLAGALGVAMHWAHSRKELLGGLSVDINLPDADDADLQDEFQRKHSDSDTSAGDTKHAKATPPPAVLASLLASMVTRQAAQYAFQDKRRAMTTPDVLTTLGTAFEAIVEESYNDADTNEQLY